METQRKLRDQQFQEESKMLKRKEREARRLELLEAEVLKRLKDTHLRQQQAIEEIQDIFSKRDHNGSI